MSDNSTPWILDELDQAAEEWDRQPEWMKPLTSAPYFASRQVVPDGSETATHGK